MDDRISLFTHSFHHYSVSNNVIQKHERALSSHVIYVKMASCFVSVPTKRTWEVDLLKPLKSFISDTYSGPDSDDLDQALNEFNKLRNSTISKANDKHESSLEVLYRYSDSNIVFVCILSVYLYWQYSLLDFVRPEFQIYGRFASSVRPLDVSPPRRFTPGK